jgi:acetyl esterase/lipase
VIDRRAMLGMAAGAAIAPALAPTLTHAQTSTIGVLAVWPDEAPGMPATPPVLRVEERGKDPAHLDRAVYGTVKPWMEMFRPVKPNGSAVLVIPGGGYEWIGVDKEGHEVARWLASHGFTAFVLFYRLPGDGWAAGPDVALSDAQRAMRVIRHRASGDGVDPDKIAVMGFSAGGHLAADLMTRFAAKTYEPTDAADALSARPSVAAPIYPVVSMSLPVAHPGSRTLLIGEHAGPALEAAHSPDRNVPADAPPVFLVHAEDDGLVPVENSLLLRAALKARGVKVETHLFAEGGHGFGLDRRVGEPVLAWPDLFLRWAASQGLGKAV